MIGLAAAAALLSVAALVKIFERRLPVQAVQAGILVAVLGPLAGVAYAVWTVWQRWVSPVDLVLLAGLLVATGLGSSLGYHRLLTHRALQAGPVTRGVFLALGAMAVPSRPVDWAARHLEHHAHADRAGDPTARWTASGTPTSAGSCACPRPTGSATAVHSCATRW